MIIVKVHMPYIIYINIYYFIVRLLTEQMCEGDRCSIVKSVHPSTAPSYVYDVHFKVTIWYRDLHYCCSILACRTVKNFLRKYITNDLIKGCADSDFVHYGPLYNCKLKFTHHEMNSLLIFLYSYN